MRWQTAVPPFEFGYLPFMATLGRCEQRFPDLQFYSSSRGSTRDFDCVKRSYDVAQGIVSSLNDLNHQSNKGAL
jgi:hypothetical protein